MLLPTILAVATSLTPTATVKNDYSDPNRQALSQALASARNKPQNWSFDLYSDGVAHVNSALDDNRVPLSPTAKSAILDNLVSVQSGQKSACSAHACEVALFVAETARNIGASRWSEAASTAVGVITNTAGFLVIGGIQASRIKTGKLD